MSNVPHSPADRTAIQTRLPAFREICQQLLLVPQLLNQRGHNVCLLVHDSTPIALSILLAAAFLATPDALRQLQPALVDELIGRRTQPPSTTSPCTDTSGLTCVYCLATTDVHVNEEFTAEFLDGKNGVPSGGASWCLQKNQLRPSCRHLVGAPGRVPHGTRSAHTLRTFCSNARRDARTKASTMAERKRKLDIGPIGVNKAKPTIRRFLVCRFNILHGYMVCCWAPLRLFVLSRIRKFEALRLDSSM